MSASAIPSMVRTRAALDNIDSLLIVLQLYIEEISSTNPSHEWLAIFKYFHSRFLSAHRTYYDYCVFLLYPLGLSRDASTGVADTDPERERRLHDRLGNLRAKFDSPGMIMLPAANYILAKLFYEVGGNWLMIHDPRNATPDGRAFIKGLDIFHPSSFLWTELSGERYNTLLQKVSTIDDAASKAHELILEVVQREREAETPASAPSTASA